MQTQRLSRKLFRRHQVVNFVVKTCVGTVIGLCFVGAMIGTNMEEAHAQPVGACSRSDRTYTVVGSETLRKIAARFDTSNAQLASHNHIVNSNLIYPNQRLCIPIKVSGQGVRTKGLPAVRMTRLIVAKSKSAAMRLGRVVRNSAEVVQGNIFPYGTCTWWANQRYYQLHGTFVPWQAGANAWQWTSRASEYGWQVSSVPTVGSILVLQPGVQGAYWLGHVAVVEQVLGNGRVIASSMNWGGNPWAVTSVQFHTGAGVTFINQ